MGWVDGAVALLCLLAAAALPARAGIRRTHTGPLFAGFVAGATLLWTLTRDGTAATSVAAAVVGGWSMAELLWSVRPRASAFAAGACAGVAAILYLRFGAPLWLAVPIALAAPAATLALTQRGALMDGRIRDEALVGLTWVAVLGAIGPALMAGWDSAVALNRSEGDPNSGSAPSWVWVFVALAASAGLIRGWWTKR